MQAVQSELSPMVMDLAPPGMPANQQVNASKYSFFFFLEILFLYNKIQRRFSVFIQALCPHSGAVPVGWR